MKESLILKEGCNVLFLVNSPFQALCAVEAINKYSIKNYEMYVTYYHTEHTLDQIDGVLSLFNVPYNHFLLNYKSAVVFSINNILKGKRYDLAFVGDYYRILHRFFSVLSLKRNGKIIYLDDGNSTINIFRDRLAPAKTNFSFRVFRTLSYFIAGIKRIPIEKFFFSIFPDIPNDKYVVIENTFSSISCIYKQRNIKSLSLFIGTEPVVFCKENNITIQEYHNILEEVLANNNKEPLYYIPHGGDKDMFVIDLCKIYGVEYRKLSVCIELFILQNGIFPKLLMGFSSSALYSLKKMFPDSEVQNVRILSSNPSEEYEDIANYYQKHGIENVSFHV